MALLLVAGLLLLAYVSAAGAAGFGMAGKPFWCGVGLGICAGSLLTLAGWALWAIHTTWSQ